MSSSQSTDFLLSMAFPIPFCVGLFEGAGWWARRTGGTWPEKDVWTSYSDSTAGTFPLGTQGCSGGLWARAGGSPFLILYAPVGSIKALSGGSSSPGAKSGNASAVQTRPSVTAAETAETRKLRQTLDQLRIELYKAEADQRCVAENFRSVALEYSSIADNTTRMIEKNKRVLADLVVHLVAGKVTKVTTDKVAEKVTHSPQEKVRLLEMVAEIKETKEKMDHIIKNVKGYGKIRDFDTAQECVEQLMEYTK